MSPLPSESLEIYLLGRVPLDQILSLQRRLAYDMGDHGGGALILCEHPPVITVGRSGSRLHINADDDELRDLGLSMRWVNRGGGCLLHLPGQLAAYLIFPLQRRNLDLGRYVKLLHAVLLDVLAEFDLKGKLYPEVPGAFVGYSRVGSVAISVNRWIATYGLTLNVGSYLTPFDLVREPGINGWPLKQTSLEAQRQRIAPMAKVREAMIRHIEARFDLERHHVYTDHPLVRPKAQTHVYSTSLG